MCDPLLTAFARLGSTTCRYGRPDWRRYAFFEASFFFFDSTFFCSLALLALVGGFLALLAGGRLPSFFGLLSLAAASLRAAPLALVVVPCGRPAS